MYIRYQSYKTECSTGVEQAYPYPLNMKGHLVGVSLNLTIAKMYIYIVIIVIIIIMEKNDTFVKYL